MDGLTATVCQLYKWNNQIKLSASSQQVFITNIKRIQSIDFVFIFCNEWSVNND